MQNSIIRRKVSKTLKEDKNKVKDATLFFRVPAKLKERFVEYCLSEAIRPSDYLRALVELSVNK